MKMVVTIDFKGKIQELPSSHFDIVISQGKRSQRAESGISFETVFYGEDGKKIPLESYFEAMSLEVKK